MPTMDAESDKNFRKEYRLTRIIRAPVDAVADSWLDPAKFSKWFNLPDLNYDIRHDVELGGVIYLESCNSSEKFLFACVERHGRSKIKMARVGYKGSCPTPCDVVTVKFESIACDYGALTRYTLQVEYWDEFSCSGAEEIGEHAVWDEQTDQLVALFDKTNVIPFRR